MKLHADRKTPIEIKKVNSLDPKEVRSLYEDAGWWKENYQESFILPMIKGSFCFAAVFKGQNLVGMGRAISDGVSDAYIQDIVIHSSLRGFGLGAELVRFITEDLKSHGIDWIGLIAAPDTEEFYNKLGFYRMNSHTPMLLRD